MKRLVAVHGWRWEPEWLVQELWQNLAPIVDDTVFVDDRARTGPWGHEGAYRRRQRALLRDAGAEWVLLTSPDERFEDGAGEAIREVIEHGPQDQVYTLRVCEMWTPTAYRVDGSFAHRPRFRLFPLAAMERRLPNRRIHSKPVNKTLRRRAVHLDVRIYHLKHILPENRARRVATMKALDAETGKHRPAVWEEFLADDAAVQLEEVPPDRSFSPPLTRDFHWDPQ